MESFMSAMHVKVEYSPEYGEHESAAGGSSKQLLYPHPQAAAPNAFNAPVHIDVGGTIYTSSLETLTSVPQSRLSQMFNGTLPIVLDTLKQHYFIDRDGTVFRHILNYMRNKCLILPAKYSDTELLLNEAKYFELEELGKQIEKQRKMAVAPDDAEQRRSLVARHRLGGASGRERPEFNPGNLASPYLHRPQPIRPNEGEGRCRQPQPNFPWSQSNEGFP